MLDEKEATESCEGLCAGVEVVQRVGESVEEELWEGDKVSGAAGEPLGVALGHADADAGAVADESAVPLAVL